MNSCVDKVRRSVCATVARSGYTNGRLGFKSRPSGRQPFLSAAGLCGANTRAFSETVFDYPFVPAKDIKSEFVRLLHFGDLERWV